MINRDDGYGERDDYGRRERDRGDREEEGHGRSGEEAGRERSGHGRHDRHDRKRDDGDYNGKHRTNPFAYCLSLGFFAGLIWGLLRWGLYLVHFTKVIPGFLADFFFRVDFLRTGWGHATGLGFFILFSIIAAMLYKLMLGRLSGPWPGLGYGLLWWLLLFGAVGPMTGITPTIRRLGYDSLVTELSVFLMWGLFIGYTIAFEYNDEASREPLKKKIGLAKAGS